MMMRALKIVILLALLVSQNIFADDQNTSLINADKSVYVNLLKTLKESKTSNDEIALQKVLLEKLINTTPASTAPDSEFT